MPRRSATEPRTLFALSAESAFKHNLLCFVQQRLCLSAGRVNHVRTGRGGEHMAARDLLATEAALQRKGLSIEWMGAR